MRGQLRYSPASYAHALMAIADGPNCCFSEIRASKNSARTRWKRRPNPPPV